MKRMKKFVFVLVVALVLSSMVFSMTASAYSPNADADVPTEKEMQTLCEMVDAANATIELAVKIAQKTPYNDVKLLLKTVDAIANGVFSYAEHIGAEVVCEYTEYVVDGQTLLIDPIRVINIPVQTQKP